MSISTRCTICQVRPAAPAAERVSADMIYCTPCATEADHENHHSDNGHDEILAADAAGEKLSRKGWNFTTQKAMDEWLATEREIMSECWLCRPELNEAQREYKPRKGVSRTGQTQVVPIKAPGTDKAEAVRKALEAIGWTAHVSTRKSITILTCGVRESGSGAALKLQWDGMGRYMYGPSVYGDKKVRNAKEAVRILSGLGAE